VRALTRRVRVSAPGVVTELFEETEARAARDRADLSPFLIFHEPREVEVCIPVRQA